MHKEFFKNHIKIIKYKKLQKKNKKLQNKKQKKS